MYYHTKYKSRSISINTHCNNTTTPHRQTNTHSCAKTIRLPKGKER